jgi:hypothetical protein
MIYWLWFSLIVALATGVAASLIILSFRAKPPRRDFYFNSILVFFSTVYFLLAAEAITATFFIQSHAVGATLAHRKWSERYWYPYINSYGYRDHEPVWKDRILFVVGDSFAAGAGVEKLDERMSGRLAQALGPHWTVATIAKPGWDTKDELIALERHPKKPDAIVLSYFLNDIENAAARHGMPIPVLAQHTSPFQALIDHSYLVNWFFWRLNPMMGDGSYWSFARSAYASPEIFADHLSDLSGIVRYAQNAQARLYIIIWPVLTDIPGSAGMTGKVYDSLRDKGVRVIDLSPHLAGVPTSKVIANNSDPHPSVWAHARAAELIFSEMQRDGLTLE